MRKPWIILGIAVGVGVIALQYVFYPPTFTPPSEPCDSSEIGSRDYSIYRTLLEENTPGPSLTDGATIFISETTDVSYRHRYLSLKVFSVDRLPKEIMEEQNVALSMDAVANFLRLSSEIIPLDREQFSGLPLVLASREEVRDVFENRGGWLALGASRLFSFSRIGFSCDGNQALVYRGESCGALCGYTELVVLEKKGDKWQVVLTRMLSVS